MRTCGKLFSASDSEFPVVLSHSGRPALSVTHAFNSVSIACRFGGESDA